MLIAIQMVMVMRLSSIMRKMMMTMWVITCFKTNNKMPLLLGAGINAQLCRYHMAETDCAVLRYVKLTEVIVKEKLVVILLLRMAMSCDGEKR